MDHGIILRHGAHFEPDAPQSIRIMQGRVGGHIRIVVPDEPVAQGREIGQQNQENDQTALPDRQRAPGKEHAPGEGCW